MSGHLAAVMRQLLSVFHVPTTLSGQHASVRRWGRRRERSQILSASCSQYYFFLQCTGKRAKDYLSGVEKKKQHILIILCINYLHNLLVLYDCFHLSAVSKDKPLRVVVLYLMGTDMRAISIFSSYFLQNENVKLFLSVYVAGEVLSTRNTTIVLKNKFCVPIYTWGKAPFPVYNNV